MNENICIVSPLQKHEDAIWILSNAKSNEILHEMDVDMQISNSTVTN